ncbi:MAG: 50S ribosomal protein L25 [Nitrospiraceae bacterium]|nr:MAG: 50S ribosomal protein L25 [Nitrospiraceae bacterium]
MEKILLKAETRTETGKGSARSMRRKEALPAVMYGEGKSMLLKLDRNEIQKLIYTGVGEHALITLELNEGASGTSEHPVLIKDYQREPLTDELLHVDFLEVSLKKKIKVMVLLVISKEPAGVKMGGIMQHRVREIEVECLPTQIPDKIEIDAGAVEIGGAMHVSDIPLMEGVKIITDPSEVILSVTAPKEEAVAAPVAEAEAAEPEVIKAKGKAEEEASQKEQKEKKEK